MYLAAGPRHCLDLSTMRGEPLSDFGICDGSTLEVRVRMRGGANGDANEPMDSLFNEIDACLAEKDGSSHDEEGYDACVDLFANWKPNW
jgi:hypothetical protein